MVSMLTGVVVVSSSSVVNLVSMRGSNLYRLKDLLEE